MSEDKFEHAQNGQAFNQEELNVVAEEAAFADDRVLAELLRVLPYDGVTVQRRVIPTAEASTDTTRQNLLRGSTNATVVVNPFRVLIGSRVTAAAGGGTKNWRDIRTKVVAGATNVYNTVAIGANASGNPRWDLIYATVAVDASSGTVSRKVKDPTTGVPSTQSVSLYKVQTVTLNVFAGTPGATPAFPTLPADPVGGYNVALGYVRVANGFGGASTVNAVDLRESADVAQLTPAVGATPLRFAEHQDSRILSTQLDTWGSAGTRPEIYAPRTWSGGESLVVMVDLRTPVSANGDIIDNSRDWRNRYWRFHACGSSAVPIRMASRSSASNDVLPRGGVNQGANRPVLTDAGTYGNADVGLGQSFQTDVNGFYKGPGDEPAVAWYDPDGGGATYVVLYVDLGAGGALKLREVGASNVRVLFWLDATAPMPNRV